MKLIKKTLLLTVLLTFTTITYSEAKDCSTYKSKTQKFLCEQAQKVTGSSSSSSSDSTKKAKKKKAKKEKKASTNSFNEKYKTLADIFKKKN